MRAQLEDYQQQTVSFEKQFQAIKEEADALSNTYFDTSQSYNTIKQNVHKFDLELDRLRKQETHLKMSMKNLNLRKMMVTKVKQVSKP